jgi:hypothetical protein
MGDEMSRDLPSNLTRFVPGDRPFVGARYAEVAPK